MQPPATAIPQPLAESDFSIHNIPFGVCHFLDTKVIHPSTRLGDVVVSLKELETAGAFSEAIKQTGHQGHLFQEHTLNRFMSCGRPVWQAIRIRLINLFTKQAQQVALDVWHNACRPINQVKMLLPAQIGDYTDFYSSRAHAFNVGSIIRGPANALNENWLHIPIGYHGRSSTIVVSGTQLRRPRGQVKAKDATVPSFSQCKRLDYELEIGAFIGGRPNQLGHPIKVAQAWDYVFGFVLLNDWSYRDFQTWQYVPLGPFTAKNGMTTISPWIVTVDALRGRQVELQPQVQPEPLLYLREKPHVSFDLPLEVSVRPAGTAQYHRVTSSNMKYLYWSPTQQLTHHSVSGCEMRAGDLLGSGTISGDKEEEFGSLLELTWGGTKTIKLGAVERKFLEDGDSVRMSGATVVNGHRVGFGECQGTIVKALPETEYY